MHNQCDISVDVLCAGDGLWRRLEVHSSLQTWCWQLSHLPWGTRRRNWRKSSSVSVCIYCRLLGGEPIVKLGIILALCQCVLFSIFLGQPIMELCKSLALCLSGFTPFFFREPTVELGVSLATYQYVFTDISFGEPIVEIGIILALCQCVLFSIFLG